MVMEAAVSDAVLGRLLRSFTAFVWPFMGQGSPNAIGAACGGAGCISVFDDSGIKGTSETRNAASECDASVADAVFARIFLV